MGIETLGPDFGRFISGLSFGQGFAVLQPLVIFVFGMVIYAIIVFTFYSHLSRKEVIRVSKGGEVDALHKIAYGLEYIFLFPVIAFAWFFIISILLALLSEILIIGNIFLIAMATLGTIRATAFYNEHLSREIAKTIPLALLGVFLLDITNVSALLPIAVGVQILDSLDILFYYFIFIVSLELVLKAVDYYLIPAPVRKKKFRVTMTSPGRI